MAIHSSTHAWKIHGQKSLVGYGPWGCKELDRTERLHFHFLLSCIGEGNGNPLQCSCLENPRDRGAWWAGVHGVATEQLHFHFSLSCIGEGNGNPLQGSCLENPRDGGAWWAAVYGVAQSRTRLSDFTFAFHFHALEKEMATHSSILAWRIPGMGELGGLLSMGSHRVEHD